MDGEESRLAVQFHLAMDEVRQELSSRVGRQGRVPCTWPGTPAARDCKAAWQV